ncbi:MAG: hypothetical protein RLZZ437_1483 [Pseudomonadota bacterium]|jgi:hypothetical protein
MSVFANGREVSGKAQPNQVIAGFPSVCMSPPPPPAGPVPIPYPMFTQANRTTQGTTTVKIKRKEVGKKNASTYKDSKGNEPATRSFGMDVVSHTLSGASKHEAYSFDVKAQNSGVERFMDLTTTNHSNPATALTINTASLNVDVTLDHDDPCAALDALNEETRKNWQKTNNPDYVQNTANGNTTITSSLYIPPGAGDQGGKFKQASSRKIMSQFDDTLAEGLTEEQLNSIKNREDKEVKSFQSTICNGHTYEQATYMPHYSHTEARLLEDIFRGRKQGSEPHMGKVILKINWPGAAKKNALPTDPCPHCAALLCAAAPCIDIVLCNEENEPVNYNEKCSEFPPPP